MFVSFLFKLKWSSYEAVLQQSLEYMSTELVKPYIGFVLETLEPDLASIQKNGLICWFEQNSTLCAFWQRIVSFPK